MTINKTLPARRAVAPVNDTDHSPARGIYVGGTGNLVVRMPAAPDTDVTFTAIAAGCIHPIETVQVRSSSTATDLLLIY